MKEHAKKVEELTMEQFEDALLGAIKSGDFIRCVSRVDLHNMKQGVSYLLYKAKHDLSIRIISLERQNKIMSDYILGLSELDDDNWKQMFMAKKSKYIVRQLEDIEGVRMERPRDDSP